ncbi:Putative motility protein [Proteiniborus ethanoligenes]|uniref:Putative motility protein n=1 Tax=Proteiniborus ethanoligenes TaxID=415015 RepID=A0A1H3QX84_9FIRM|nr:YjfB family protein [Proteiniborus ethanoligenes]SDZ17701.1 Putative motility protein [Proteiniborus ethanoligenes]
MDIAAMSSMISQSSIQQQASLSVLKLSMESAETQAANLTQMISDTSKSMELSVSPHLGANIDIKL